jgi:KaiC/GvpD/RAD55 family RecA-like ATPase
MAIPINEVDGFFADDPSDNDAQTGQAPVSTLDVIDRWRADGPLVRVPTGIRPLDELCRGGFPIPWRVFIIGAPSAGKTFVAVAVADSIAKRLEAEGLCVGILGIDEEPDDLTVRFAQMAGFTVGQAEQRDSDVLDAMAEKLAELNVHLYDATFTIEAAAEDLAARAKAQGKRPALFIDSIHAAKSAAAVVLETDSIRLVIQANVDAVRKISTRFRMLVVATAEANRASYRTDEASDQMNDLAAGAESRAIEFTGQTLLMLRTTKDHPDVSHVRVPKNRRARHGEFWLRLDREKHAISECSDPSDAPGVAQQHEHKKRAKNRHALEQDAVAVLRVIVAEPGSGERALRAKVRLTGMRIGVERLDAIVALLTKSGRIANRPTQNGQRSHYFAVAKDGGQP